MSANADYHIRIIDGEGRQPRVDEYHKDPLAIVRIVCRELTHDPMFRIIIEREES